MKANALLSRLAIGAASTFTSKGVVLALPTRRAGISSMPVRRGVSVTAYCALLRVAPPPICSWRLLLCALRVKSACSGV